ncbi:MAG: hypothetical protein HKO92_02615 [Flavobacteriaceae bacterium]|nr:hypothetical protein [Flavobacteriaceae bacterium]
MKKSIVLLIVFLVTLGCKNDTNKSVTNDADSLKNPETQNDELKLFKGDFLYYADAAILQTKTEIYGVIINDKAHELHNTVKAYKTEDTDMVPVEIKGIIVPKPENEEGWDFRIDIKEILKVSKPKKEDNQVIKLQ